VVDEEVCCRGVSQSLLLAARSAARDRRYRAQDARHAICAVSVEAASYL